MRAIFLVLLFAVCLGDLAQVQDIPGFGAPKTKMLSGNVLTNSTYGTELFMMFFESQSGDPKNDPLVLWLQGGPGCSSLFGAFIENGPYKMSGDGSITENPYSWNKNANMLYIDSPPGTGFSTTNNPNGYDNNEYSVSLDLYNALQQFYHYDNGYYQRLSRFYIAGESYAGKYVPYLAAKVLNATGTSDFNIPLVGIMIGNGWVFPNYQMKSYVPFLELHNLISSEDKQWALSLYPQFDKYLSEGNYVAAAAIDNQILGRLTQDAGINDPYNIRKRLCFLLFFIYYFL